MPESKESLGIGKGIRQFLRKTKRFYFSRGPFAFLVPPVAALLFALPFTGIGPDTELPLALLIIAFLAFCLYKTRENKNPIWDF